MQTTKTSKRLTPEQKQANKLARQEARKQAKELARIEREKNQKEVREITINIEWVKSRMWGYNPKCTATVRHKDGSFSYGSATASGCGYDKESTVIAEIFNNFLKYKLYRELKQTEQDRRDGMPYGIYISQYRHFSGGIGTDCYYSISEAIGGKFEKIASGKSFDAFKYTDLS
jgi:hypothetical protein